MKLVIGGFAQGKLEYVIRTTKTAYRVIDETTYRSVEETEDETIIINHLHLIIRKIGSREAAQGWIRELIGVCTKSDRNLIFISDEVGSGVIPLDGRERKLREDTGRILCELAKEADCVERILCGLPQILK